MGSEQIRGFRVLIFLALGVIVFGQSTDDRDFWLSLDRQEKVIFLQGIYAGLSESLQILSDEAARQKNRDPYWVAPFVHENSGKRLREYFSDKVGYDYEWMSHLLDTFYANPDNSHIKLIDALKILMLHENGQIRRANELLLLEQKKVLKDR